MKIISRIALACHAWSFNIWLNSSVSTYNIAPSMQIESASIQCRYPDTPNLKCASSTFGTKGVFMGIPNDASFKNNSGSNINRLLVFSGTYSTLTAIMLGDTSQLMINEGKNKSFHGSHSYPAFECYPI